MKRKINQQWLKLAAVIEPNVLTEVLFGAANRN